MKQKILSIIVLLLMLNMSFLLIQPTKSIEVLSSDIIKTVDDDLSECPDADYTNIQDAIDDSKWGGPGGWDKIIVYPGIYDGFEIKGNKNWAKITGIDAESTIIDGKETGDIITIKSDWVEIKNFSIINSGKDNAGLYLAGDSTDIKDAIIYSNNIGIKITGSADLYNCNIFENYDGIYNKARLVIKKSTISNNLNSGIVHSGQHSTFRQNIFSSNGDYGLQIRGSYADVIKNDIINNTKGGIYCTGDFTNLKENVIKYNKGHGLECEGSIDINYNEIMFNQENGIYAKKSYTDIQNNTIKNNRADGVFCSGIYTKVIGNSILDNQGYGIKVTGEYSDILGNTVSKNIKDGIFLKDKSSEIKKNIITDNMEIGLNILIDEKNNIEVWKNHFSGNNKNVIFDCNQNNDFSKWNNEIVGNYWEEFDTPEEGAVDNNNDGIIENSFKVPGNNNAFDYHPYIISFLDNKVPNKPIVRFYSNTGKVDVNHTFVISKSKDPDGKKIYYIVDWGDGSSNKTKFVENSEKVTLNHKWQYFENIRKKSFQVSVYACDIHDQKSEKYELEVTITNDPPTKPIVPLKPIRGKKDEHISISFRSCDPNNNKIYYFVQWVDNPEDTSDISLFGPYEPGKKITKTHNWSESGNYTVRIKAIDEFALESDWARNITIYISEDECESKKNFKFSKIFDYILSDISIFNIFEKIINLIK